MQALGLVADIGGTNARFALVARGGIQLQQVATLAVGEFASIDAAIRCYLEKTGLTDQVREACLAIACPVEHDRISMTNSGWCFSRKALQRSLGLDRLLVINDYAAQAYAVPFLAPAERTQVGTGEGLAGYPLALVGPGTGLGVGGLIFAGGSTQALVTEGGHVDFAPANELEIEILRYLLQRYPHVSAERLLSGMGLSNLHQALAAIRGQQVEPLSPAEVTSAALSRGDRLCLEVLDCFCAILGSVAGNVALTQGARGGVYITGGIVPRMLDFFSASAFRQRFEAKGRFSAYLADIPTFVVTAAQPGLLGSAARLKSFNCMPDGSVSEERA